MGMPRELSLLTTGNTESIAIADHQEKRFVALTSVAAGAALTLSKLIAGLLTGSLGLLAEAAHSGLDLVAALMTVFAIRVADRPPDHDHPYGHGKAENLSAFSQSGLLLLTAVWILYEAIQRLFFHSVEVEPTIWAFVIMLGSIVVDYSRSRALSRAALRYDSQALAADALHFRTDIWSSAVVLVGLAAVQVGQLADAAGPWQQADAVAAIAVALVVILVGGRLAKETIDALLDRAPIELTQRLAVAAASVPGVLESRRVRLRRAGNKHFADLVVAVPRTTTLAQSHIISDAIEEVVRQVQPRTDVVVHIEPAVTDQETAVEQIHFVARQLGAHIHDVRVREVDGRIEADLHLEIDPSLPLGQAHGVAEELERAIVEENPAIQAVRTHLEGLVPTVEHRQEVTASRPDLVEAVTAIADRLIGPGSCYEVRVYQESAGGGPPDLILRCTFSEGLRIDQTHERSAEMERALRSEIGKLGSILIDADPLT